MATTASPRLTSILAQLEPRLGRQGSAPVALAGGITNINFRVRFGDHEYVVRLPGKDTRLLGISRRAECLATEAAAALGLGPAVATVLDECLVTRYVTCRAVGSDELRGEPESAARALRSFHDSGTSLPVRFDVPRLLEDYAAVLRDRGHRPPGELREARRVAGEIEAALRPTDPAPCHNDLLATNFIRADPDGRLLLVDWEYAGMGDRRFDLGNLSVNNEFDEQADRRLLSAYFGEAPDSARRASLALMRVMSDAREAAWGMLQERVSELEFDFAAYARRHFERMRDTAASPAFGGWLRAAAA